MARRALALTVALSAAAAPALAKFGISKTKVVLPRQQPPEFQLLGETVSLEVSSRARAVTDRHLETVRGQVETALTQNGVFRVVDRPEDADNAVRITLDELQARFRDSITYETKYVKTGERQEWDEKKKQMVTKDVYGNREEPVPVRIVNGHLVGYLEVETRPATPRRVPIGDRYDQEFKGSSAPPEEASSETALEDWLVEQAGLRAAAAVSFSPDPVTAMLAVDGELKAGNRLAEAGRFQEALAEWNRKPLKGDKEAARLHNVGVAHEALAYAFPVPDPQHAEQLREAQRDYQEAARLDPDEKYFAEPQQRIAVSLEYAERASRMMAELEASRAERGPRAGGGPAKTAGPGLRNGSFESSLEPWRLDGTGALLTEGRRGRVLELAARTGPVSAHQELDLEYGKAGTGALSFDYRVMAGEPPIKVVVRYQDTRGRDRTSVMEVTSGEGPAGWSSWETDLDRLRPSPSRLKEVTVQVEAGTVRLDNVALTMR
jgi:hypothetical protein